MPPLPVIANVFRVSLEWTHATLGHAANVLHFLGTPGTASGLWTALDANVTAAMWEPVPNGADITEVKITPLDGVTATATHSPGEAARWGGGATAPGVPATCALVRLATPLRGASHRGRVYVPWVTEGTQTEGTLNEATRATMAGAWATFRTDMDTDGYTLQVASYLLEDSATVTSLSVDDKLATQRRRQSRLR